jgi:hypothetical protein
MSTRKTTLFRAADRGRLAVGMVIASRLDLTPPSPRRRSRTATTARR